MLSSSLEFFRILFVRLLTCLVALKAIKQAKRWQHVHSFCSVLAVAARARLVSQASKADFSTGDHHKLML